MNLDEIRNIDIEQNILGSMIQDLSAALTVKNRGVKAKDFYLDKHKEIFKGVNVIFKQHNEIDIVMLLDYLNSKGLIDKAGGATYITEIYGSVATTSSINSYIDRLLQYSSKRELHELSKYINDNLDKDMEYLKSQVHDKVLKIYDVGQKEKTTEEYGIEFITKLEERAVGKENSMGIPTGLKALDEAIGGFDKAELITLFAFSGVGKTTLAGQIALNMIQQNKKVLFFSFEMPPRQMIERLIANSLSIESDRMRKGKLSDDEWGKVMKATDYLCNSNRIIFKSCRGIDEVIAQIQLEKLKDDIDIVFIDYITLIQAPEAQRKDLTIAYITQSLKSLAISLDIPIVALAQAKQSVQANNNTGAKVNEKLSETDIAESASIYRDSDKVIGMYRNVELDDPMARQAAHNSNTLNYYSKDATINPDCVNLLIKKCRNGTKGSYAFKWEGKYFRISNGNFN